MTEIWKPVVGWEGWYEVSDQGNVRSIDRWITYSDGRRRFYSGQLLSQSLNGPGYLYVNLFMNANHKVRQVHGLVGHAFIDESWSRDFDHKDLNKLNNCVCNLRKATRSQNKANSIKSRGVSNYKGVYHEKRSKINPWVSDIRVNYKTIHLGRFPTQEQAAAAYNEAATKHFREFARVNEI